jgi:integrase
MAITSLELDALKPKDKPYLIREKQHNKKDGTLAFKILTSGDIDGYFIYYTNGKEKQKKIGRYGKAKNMMTLKVIRDKYTTLSKMYQGGIDVKAQELERAVAQEKEQKKKASIERKNQLQGSFQQLVDLYIEHARVNFSGHYHKSITNAFALNLKGFDTTIKANEITKSDIKNILRPIMVRGSLIMANRMRAYLSAAFEWGRELELEEDDGEAISLIEIDVQFFIKINPVIGVNKPLKEEEPTDRFLTQIEVHIFWQALNNSSMSVYRKNILMLMLATGARVEALAGLRWDEVDLTERLIDIPPSRSKNRKHWIIPINDIAYDILSNNPRSHNELLFPADNGYEALRSDGINQATRRLCEQVNIKRFTPKDLRTTFKTLAGHAGLTKVIRDRLQNHALGDVSDKHYDRYDYLKEKRRAMAAWNKYLKHIICDDYLDTLKNGAQVLPFKKHFA